MMPDSEGGDLQVPIYKSSDFDAMRRVGRLTAQTLDMVHRHVRPGVSTGELDRLCSDFILTRGARSASLNYRGFPRSICTSVNREVCHGIPNESRALLSGDIVNVDVGVELDGWYGDSSRVYGVGDRIPLLRRRIAEAAYEALHAAMREVRPGARMGSIGAVIEEVAHTYGYSVVRDFCGHGLGRKYHDAPTVLHYGVAGKGLELRSGMFFTIEPILSTGKPEVKILSDGWTAVTKDGSVSAQFEHSVGVTENGCEIFTLSTQGLDFPLRRAHKPA